MNPRALLALILLASASILFAQQSGGGGGAGAGGGGGTCGTNNIPCTNTANTFTGTQTAPTFASSTSGVSVVNLSPTTIAGLASVTTTTNPILTAGVSVVEVTDGASYGDTTVGGGSVVELLQCQTVVAGACTSWVVAPSANGTLVKIGPTQTASGSVATITFSSIPQTYSTLRLVAVINDSVANVAVEFNQDATSGDYQWQQWFVTNGGSSGTGHGSGLTHGLYAGQGTDAATNTLDVPGYTNGFSKNAFSTNSVSGVWSSYTVNWSSLAAITRIDIGAQGGNFGAGSTFSLYGVQ